MADWHSLRPSFPSTLRGRIVTAVGVVIIVWFVLAYSFLISAKNNVESATDVLRVWRAESDVASMLDEQIDPELLSALGNLKTAEARANSVLLAPARALPVFRTQIQSIETMTSAGIDVVQTAIDGQSNVIEATYDYDIDHDRLALLETIADVSIRTANGLGAIDLGSADGLRGPLPEIYDQFEIELADAIEDADRAVEVTSALRAFLEGPTKYLLLGTNNAEMRSGGGTVLSIGALEAIDGEISISEFADVDEYEIVDPFVSSDIDLHANWGWLLPTADWRNLAITPRFDLTARTAAAMWQSLTGERVDGVIAIDPVALSRLVEVTGEFAANNTTWDSSGLLYFLLAGQYEGFEAQFYPAEGEQDRLYEHVGTEEFASLKAARQSWLRELIEHVAGNITRGDLDLELLGDELLGLANTRHLMVWSPEPQFQRAWIEAGVSGRIEQRSLMVSLVNRGANKLDYFTTVGVEVEATNEDDQLHVTLHVTAANNAPDGLRRNQAGPNVKVVDDPLAFGEYFGVLAVTLPRSATNVRVSAGQIVASGPDGEAQVIALRARVERGSTTSWDVRFRLPADETVVVLEPSGRLAPTDYVGNGIIEGDDVRHEVDLATFAPE